MSDLQKNADWPTMLIVYQAGYHDCIPELLEVILQDFRIKVIKAGSESEVILAMSSAKFDLFLVAGCGSSQIAPGSGEVLASASSESKFDGLRLARLLKKALPRVPGIFASGYLFDESMLADLDRHGLAFLSKPFGPDELIELVLLLLWRGGESASNALHFFSCGLMKQVTGDLQGSLRDLDRAIDLDPRDAEARNLRGEVKRDLGDYAGAVADCDAALDILPGYTEAYFNRGAAWCALGNLDGATSDLDKAIELDPGFGKAYYCRGSIRWFQRNVQGALSDLNRAETCRNFQPTANFYDERGDVKQILGDLDGAITDYDCAIKMTAAASTA